MNLSINCKVSLSKKLRSLVEGQACTVVLTTDDLENGKGQGRLSITTGAEIPNDIPIGLDETSISITPIDIADEVPELTAIGTIFTTGDARQANMMERTSAVDKAERTAVDKIAVTEAPEKKDVPHAVIAKAELETPETFKEMKEPSCKNYVSNLEELLSAAREAANKSVDVDIGSAQNEREKAVLLERKEKGESIDIPAYVVNDQAGVLSVNDLGITLNLNVPFNLANLSGRRVAESGELRGLLRAGIVRFISPQEAQLLMDNMDDNIVKAPTLDVFDNREQAEAHMTGEQAVAMGAYGSEPMELTMDDLDAPTQEESMIIDLTENTSVGQVSQGSRTSIHGSTPATARKRVPTATDLAEPNKNPALHTIKKLS